jgi:hypothetical protein
VVAFIYQTKRSSILLIENDEVLARGSPGEVVWDKQQTPKPVVEVMPIENGRWGKTR